MSEKIHGYALSSLEKVREVSAIITKNSDAIHSALRRFSAAVPTTGSGTAYALLTEEYALRARAHILGNDAERFVVSDFLVSQEELVRELLDTEERFRSLGNLDELSDLVTALILFSNAIVSKKNTVMLFLLKNLSDTRLCA